MTDRVATGIIGEHVMTDMLATGITGIIGEHVMTDRVVT